MLLRTRQERRLAVVLLTLVCSFLKERGPRAAEPDAWPAVMQEERAMTKVAQDPDADAVVLLNEQHGKILKKGADTVNVISRHVRIKILTERGKRYTETKIPAGKYSRVSGIRARTVKPDGVVVPVMPDQIFEKVAFQAGSYKETQWVFTFPAADVGAIIEYRYDRHDNSILSIDPFYFAGPEFTLVSRMTQAIPGDMGYAFLCTLCPEANSMEVTPWRDGKMKGRLFAKELRDLPGYREELLMPPARDVTPRMEFVLREWRGIYFPSLGRQDRAFSDWASVAQDVRHNYQSAVKEGASQFVPLVEQWVRGTTTSHEKVKAIFRHVQRDFRYLSFDDVYGRSRSVATMIKESIADNEEKAVLLMAALKAAGIDAHPAIVAGRHGGTLNPKFPGLSQFTHTIVAVPQPDGGSMWLDPTVAFAPFGFVSWKNSGADALLIRAKDEELLTLASRSEVSASRYKVMLTPRTDGKADLAVEAEFTGEDAIDLRDDLVPAAEGARLSFMQRWVAAKVNGAALRSHSFEDLDDVDKPLRIKMIVEAPSLVTSADDLMLVRGCALTCEEINPVSRGFRHYDFYVDRGWNEEETVVIQAPVGLQAVSMPPAVVAKSEIGSLTLSCFPAGDGARCTRQFVARRNRWPASVQDNLRKMYDKIIEADRLTVALQPAEAGTAGR